MSGTGLSALLEWADLFSAMILHLIPINCDIRKLRATEVYNFVKISEPIIWGLWIQTDKLDFRVFAYNHHSLHS